MRFSLSTRRPTAGSSDLLVVPTTTRTWADDIAVLDLALDGIVRAEAKRTEFTAAAGTTLVLATHRATPARAILLVGIEPDKGTVAWHQVADATVRVARERKAKAVTVLLAPLQATPAAVAALVEGCELAAYTFTSFKSAPKPATAPAQIMLLVPQSSAPVRAAVTRGQLFAQGTAYARTLIMTPADVVTPTYLANEARRLARRDRLRVRIHDQRALQRLRMGAILGVAKGSAQAPCLIEVIYQPPRRATKRVAIVGKGITFDSGGLSLKNPDAMQGQKRDMAGGAAVLGAMSVIAALHPSAEVRAYVAAAENMPDGRAMRPGDVLRAHNGKTIEVLNTDAEGRLVLADALSYAAAARPDVIVDLATLTAAVAAALGRRYAGIMGTDATLTRALIAAGAKAAENLWELPLIEDYRPDITSRVADIKNTGEGYAGTIIGALFLREFTAQIPWAHIDFSSTVVTDKPFPAHPPGATGFGVRTLLEYITSL